MCDRVLQSVETCGEDAEPEASVLYTMQSSASNQDPTAPPQWCERADDPRCMPAHGSHRSNLVLGPVAPVGKPGELAIDPLRIGSSSIAWTANDRERPGHKRRIDRPPR